MSEDIEKDIAKIEDEETLVQVNEISGHTMVAKLLKKYYDPEVLEHMELTKAQVTILSNGLRTMNKNLLSKSMSLICKGPECYMEDKCPMQAARCAPIAHSCPIEMMLMEQWEKDYLEDLNIDNSKVELDMVRDLIELDVIDWRSSNELSKNGIFDWQIVGMDEKSGKPYYRKEEAVSLGIKLKMKARKDKLREDLMATRKVKAKFGVDKKIDPSKYASNLRDKYDAIKQAQVVEETKE